MALVFTRGLISDYFRQPGIALKESCYIDLAGLKITLLWDFQAIFSLLVKIPSIHSCPSLNAFDGMGCPGVKKFILLPLRLCQGAYYWGFIKYSFYCLKEC